MVKTYITGINTIYNLLNFPVNNLDKMLILNFNQFFND